MKTVKEAAKIAAEYLVELLPMANEVQLEEIESNDKHWAVTLSFYESQDALTKMLPKSYKIFIIDKHSGEVIAMKIRVLN